MQLGVAARRRRFDELSLPAMAAWGAVGGVLLGGLMMALGVHPFILVPATTLSALGATLTLTFARMAEGGERLEAGADVEDVGLSEKERRELLG